MSLHSAHGLLRCPHCGADLDADGPRWRCARGHSFDVARQGYLNLSGVAEPANADSAAMLDARARVHASGLFDPLANGLAQQVPCLGVETALEVGAGNAHFLARIVDDRPPARGVALDVSRAAARRAARAHHRVASVVGDVWQGVPLRDRAVDVVLCVFAPRNFPEFARVLRPDGRLVVATPTAEHLAGLRERYGLLGIEPGKHDRLLAAARDHLRHESTVRVKAHRGGTPTDLVDDLIAMGPNAFHQPPHAAGVEEVRLDVRIDVFRPL